MRELIKFVRENTFLICLIQISQLKIETSCPMSVRYKTNYPYISVNIVPNFRKIINYIF